MLIQIATKKEDTAYVRGNRAHRLLTIDFLFVYLNKIYRIG